MKSYIIFSLFFYCACGQTTTESIVTTDAIDKDQLFANVTELMARVNHTIQALNDENRSHLAQALQEEAERLDKYALELHSTNPGPEALRLLEVEIMELAVRLSTEEEKLEKQISTQEEVLADAHVLKEWVAQEIAKLETQNKTIAQETARALQEEERRLEVVCDELVRTQDRVKIGATEVAIRAMETRIREALKLLDFQPVTETPPQTTSLPKNQTNIP